MGDERQTAVVIIGTGFSGLGMAIQLKRAGLHDFVLLEKADDLGGTWRDNTYPGCTCDIPSQLYSFSFELNPRWTRAFPPQREIWDYLRHCARKYGIESHIRYGSEVNGAEYDQPTASWRVDTVSGVSYSAKAVVAAVGALHQPSYPNLPGLERFQGKTFHSAEWAHDYDLRGRRVAVVGTGASAIQFVPRIAPEVANLHLFQRTPPWIVPKPDKAVSPAAHSVFTRFPVLQRAYRNVVYWMLESRALGFTVNPKLLRAAQKMADQHRVKQVGDPTLRASLTPSYALGCKRVLISNDYYPALGRPNVELVTNGIAEVRESGVVTVDGVERPVDAIIFGTGFRVNNGFTHLNILGRDGITLRQAWQEGMEAYNGVVVSGFPNLFFLVGPNSGLGHNSIIFMIESQVRYVLECLKLLAGGQARAIDIRPEVQASFNQWLQSKLNGTIWSLGGCQSWYLDEHGVNRALWPTFTFRYWWRMRKPRIADYRLEV